MALKEMTTVLDCESEMLELENMHEYVPETPARDAMYPTASPMMVEQPRLPISQAPLDHQPPAPKSDELEALWPGVHQEFVPQARRSSGFYFAIGFILGAAVSLGSVFGYSTVARTVAQNQNPNQAGGKTIMIAETPAKSGGLQHPDNPQVHPGEEILLPASESYEVRPGDTLAAIALRNYKHVSPRLLDEICRANNLRNANVLNLGQKLMLPEYHSQAAQVAGSGQLQ